MKRAATGRPLADDVSSSLTPAGPMPTAAALLSEAVSLAPDANRELPPPANATAVVVQPPPYWLDACNHLQGRDRVMKRLIPQFDGIFLRSRGDAFATLARSIVGQQISVKAAQTIWDRFALLLAPDRMTPAGVLELEIGQMRAAGLSARKAEYLIDLSIKFDSGAVDPAGWDSMDDDAIAAELGTIRGIGRWTADMFLIFHMLRPNVLPLDDAGLIAGISKNYFSGEPVSRSDAREVASAWAPFCSVATWYIWRSLAPPPPAQRS